MTLMTTPGDLALVVRPEVWDGKIFTTGEIDGFKVMYLSGTDTRSDARITEEGYVYPSVELQEAREELDTSSETYYNLSAKIRVARDRKEQIERYSGTSIFGSYRDEYEQLKRRIDELALPVRVAAEAYEKAQEKFDALMLR